MAFFNSTGYRAILETETDSSSPGSEELLSQLRENDETLLLAIFGAETSGKLSLNPSSRTTGMVYANMSWTTGLHNQRLLMMLSGQARGNLYKINRTLSASSVITTSGGNVWDGGNIFADGARSSDRFRVMHNFFRSTNGGWHDHDGINSPQVVLADDQITYPKLKTATGTASGALAALANVAITMQDFCFTPNIYVQYADRAWVSGIEASNADYVGRFSIEEHGDGGTNYAAYWRYVTASDEPFIYAIRDKKTGDIVHLWTCDDPPVGYWGLNEKPDDFIPPIILTSKKHGVDIMKGMDEIVLFKQPKEMICEVLMEARINKKQPHEVINGFEFNNSKNMFVRKNISQI